MDFATADLFDEYGPELASCETWFRSYGGRSAFCGRIATVRCAEDNAVVKRMLGTAGDGRVLVVDGGGSPRTALMGDMMAASAVRNEWSGVVIFGVVRDVAALRGLDLGIKALGSNPRRSAKEGTGAVDVPVAFGDVEFRPGDWLYSDEDGILVAPRRLH